MRQKHVDRHRDRIRPQRVGPLEFTGEGRDAPGERTIEAGAPLQEEDVPSLSLQPGESPHRCGDGHLAPPHQRGRRTGAPWQVHIGRAHGGASRPLPRTGPLLPVEHFAVAAQLRMRSQQVHEQMTAGAPLRIEHEPSGGATHGRLGRPCANSSSHCCRIRVTVNR
ncbi:MAG: hypothetical protein ACK55I_39885, partial [bacterium]